MKKIYYYKKNVQNYLQDGRYVSLKNLPPKRPLIGVIVHDEVDVFKKALAKSKPIRIGKRFKARIISKKPGCILLIGTGMGCTGSSIIAYELALQKRKVPIIKIGTCVSIWQDYEVGTIFVPRWSISDEGVVHWDKRISQRNKSLSQEIKKAFKNKIVIGSHKAFTNDWKQYVNDAKWNTADAEFINGETAIWSTDAFYPLMLRPDLMKYLAQEHMIQLNHIGRDAKVQDIRRKRYIKDAKGWLKLVAWDMECAALFSACKVLDIEIAAGLVVSWSNEHWTEIGEKGKTSRNKKHKNIAHEIEHKLIVRAVEYLFSSS